MRNIATSVRITADANVTVTALAERMRASKAQVIDLALRALEERLFWQDVQGAYEALAQNKPGLARYRKEIAEWDNTLRDIGPCDPAHSRFCQTSTARGINGI